MSFIGNLSEFGASLANWLNGIGKLGKEILFCATANLSLSRILPKLLQSISASTFCYFYWTLCSRIFVFGTSDSNLYAIICQNFQYWMSSLQIKTCFFFKKNFSMSSTIVSINIFLSAKYLSFVIDLEFILAEKTVGPTQPESGCFQVFCSKTAGLFPKIIGGISTNKESLGLNDKW